jgi:hypothetical protein
MFTPDRTLPVDRIILPTHSDDYHDLDRLIGLATHSRNLHIKTPVNKPLVVFIGGARDFYHKAVLRHVFFHYATKNSAHYTIAYATHAAKEGIAALIKQWHTAGQKIYLVGHSWGGSRSLKIVTKQVKDIPIECVITLDPVSRLTRGHHYTHPKNVKLWVNSYLDYNNVSMNIPNVVAIVGGHWMHCPAADYNFAVSHYNQQEIDHMNAYVFFKRTKKFIPNFY